MGKGNNAGSSLYKRILIKLSGEALAGENKLGIHTETVNKIAEDIIEVYNLGIEVAIVIVIGFTHVPAVPRLVLKPVWAKELVESICFPGVGRAAASHIVIPQTME